MIRLLFIPVLLAISVADVPNPRGDHSGWVTDLAEVIDAQDEAALEAAIRPETKMIWIESPTNPMLRLVDFAAVARPAAPRGQPGRASRGGSV